METTLNLTLRNYSQEQGKELTEEFLIAESATGRLCLWSLQDLVCFLGVSKEGPSFLNSSLTCSRFADYSGNPISSV